MEANPTSRARSHGNLHDRRIEFRILYPAAPSRRLRSSAAAENTPLTLQSVTAILPPPTFPLSLSRPLAFRRVSRESRPAAVTIAQIYEWLARSIHTDFALRARSVAAHRRGKFHSAPVSGYRSRFSLSSPNTRFAKPPKSHLYF